MAERDVVEIGEGVGRHGAGAADGDRAFGLGFAARAGDEGVGDEDARAAGGEVFAHAREADAQG